MLKPSQTDGRAHDLKPSAEAVLLFWLCKLSNLPPPPPPRPNVCLLLNEAVGSSDDPAGRDDGAPAHVSPPPVQADLPPPVVLSRQRAPDNAPPVANLQWAVWGREDEQHEETPEHWAS